MVKDTDPKRVDGSARSVITPDPNISINQVGVPLKIAMTITFPEMVTPNNREKMKKLVKNGRWQHPGANYIVTGGNTFKGKPERISLAQRKDPPIKDGDIVERHLDNGDYVLFNRQPSLHRMSMMGHMALIFNSPNFASFRLNECVTTPYNADFDGDDLFCL